MTGKPRSALMRFLTRTVPLSTSAATLPTSAATLRLAVLPLLLAALPLLVAGCAESAQDATPPAASHEASDEAPRIPAMTAAPELSEAPEMSEAPELSEAPEMTAAPELSEAPDAPEMAATDDATPAAPSHEPVYLTSETTASMNLPFSDAVRMGHLLFLSGQIGNIPGTTDLAPGGIQGEARQTMENIRTVLEANGSSMDRVIKATVMLADISEWPAFNEVYVTYFPGHKPARSAFAGSGLAFGARCEVEVIATVGE